MNKLSKGILLSMAMATGVSTVSMVGDVTNVEAASVTKYTTANLNLRSSASTKAKVLMTIKKNTAVKVSQTKGSWAKVTVGKKTGWVSTKYLTSKKPVVVNSKTMYVKNAAPLKATASANAKTIYSAKTGQTVKVYTTTSKEYVKATISNKTGWMLKSDLTNTKTVKATVKESIKYGTTKQKDSSLPKGTTIVVKKGKNGVRTKTVEYTYKNGKIVAKKTLSSKVTAQPVKEIVKVGTSNSKYLPASEAQKILKEFFGYSSKEYQYNTTETMALRVVVGKNHVTRIYYNPGAYDMYDATLQEYIESCGKKEGTKAYKYAQKEKQKIRNAVKVATNAIYGPGTKQANDLYKKIMKSKDIFTKDF